MGAKSSRKALLGIGLVLGITLQGCGGKKEEGNRGAAGADRPSVLRVTLTPSEPRVGENVSANPEIVAGSGQKFTLTYRWTRNGNPLAGTQGKNLETKDFKKGDRIGLTVVPQDSAGEGSAFKVPEFQLKNQRPNVAKLTLNPSPPTAGQELRAVATGEDSDGDAVSLQYQWIRNGQVLGEVKGSAIPAGLLKRGDQVEVRVTPSDGAEAGSERTLGPLKVLGRPPEIRSQPPTDGFSGGVFSYKVIATEPDGGRITFSLTQGPQGMVVGSANGVLQWTLPSERGGTYPVTIKVTDEDGDWVDQSFTIRY